MLVQCQVKAILKLVTVDPDLPVISSDQSNSG